MTVNVRVISTDYRFYVIHSLNGLIVAFCPRKFPTTLFFVVAPKNERDPIMVFFLHFILQSNQFPKQKLKTSYVKRIALGMPNRPVKYDLLTAY